jgi:hypothetical protein
MPVKGESRFVYSENSLRKAYPTTFWVLFEPALSFFNGWEEHPEEIERSSFICLEVVKERQEKNGFWSVVKVTDSIPVKNITSDIPEYTGTTDHLERIQFLNTLECTELNSEWFYFCGRDLHHDSLGNWMLIRKVKSNYHLILYSVWDYSGEDGLYLGNILLSEEFFERLLESSRSW